jgi:hypothetical protein
MESVQCDHIGMWMRIDVTTLSCVVITPDGRIADGHTVLMAPRRPRARFSRGR